MNKSILLSIMILLGSNLSHANNDMVNFQSSAQLNSSCSIGATDLSFGVYDSSQSNVATGSLNVTCSRSTSYQISSNYGYYNYRNNKRMFIITDTNHSSSNPNYIPYTVYFNPVFAASTIWGDGTYGYKISGSGTGSSQTYPLYGQIAANLFPKPAVYSDNIVATISY